MASFTLEDWSPPVPVQLVGGLTEGRLRDFAAFHQWAETLQKSLARQKFHDHPFAEEPYRLRAIEVKSFYETPGGRLLFVTLEADIGLKEKKGDDGDKTLPGFAFLRGPAIAVLMILRPSDNPNERWVVMTEQPRIPAGSLQFMEIPAGMMDKEKNLQLQAAKEIKEEVGIPINAGDLENMTALALQVDKNAKSKESLKEAMYPSPGGCDEAITIYLWEKEMSRQRIETLKGRLTGERAEQENITVRLLEYERLLEVGARDAKTLAAWSLYEYIKREGMLDE